MSDQIPEYVAKIIESEVAKQVYQQGLSGTVTEVGKLGTDVMKTLRLFTLPIQVLSTFQDRVEKVLNNAKNKVPEIRQQIAPSQIVGPILEKIKYLPEEDELIKMYEELLARSIDKDRINEAHPPFVHIISQLSRDEAYLLFELKTSSFEVTDTLDFIQSENRFINRKVEKTTIPNEKLYYKENIKLYYAHLESLSLVSWPVYKQDPIIIQGKQTGIRRFSKIELTEFGKLFIKACIPEKGFA
jgi:hypothetical protein